LLKKCIICDKIDCLTFNKKLNILSCHECGVLFAEKQNNQKIHFFKKRDNPTLLAKMKNKISHELFYNLIDDIYIHYLKSKTKMDFKNALDVGTRFGGFVNKLNKFGVDAYGIEADDNLLKFAVTKKVEWGYFDENYISNKKYELICLTQMLYYLPDNFSILNHTKNMLIDNGVIFITTINPQASNIQNEKSPLPNNTINVILSKQNFESLKEKIGLEVIDYTTYRTPLYADLYTAKNPIIKKLKILQYVLKFKKPYVRDPDGEHAFILLKKIS